MKGKNTARKGTLLKNSIPVQRFWARDDKLPGFCETDTVSHDREREINSHYAWMCSRNKTENPISCNKICGSFPIMRLVS